LGARSNAVSNASGWDTTGTGVRDSIAIGSDSSAGGAGAVAIGPHAKANFTNIAIGAYADTSGSNRNAIAIGQAAKASGRISSQGAMSMAEAQMASGAAAAAVGNPNGAWSVGLGSEQGHGAISAGYAKPVGRKSQISFGAAFGGDDHSIGVGFAHKL